MDDNTLTFSTGGPALVIPDAYNRYDGLSVQDAGFSRSIRQGTAGLLWDTHTFDLSSLFGAPGTYALTMDGQMPYSDCTGLVLLIINLEAGAAPVPARNHTWGSLKAIYR